MDKKTRSLTSLQHPLVIYWARLRSDSSFRKREQKILLSGANLLREVPLEILITSKKHPPLKAKSTYFVSDAILKKITALPHPDGFAGIAAMPKESDLSKKSFLVILDEIRDPGNFGSLMRSALALGWEGIVRTPNSVDIFNDKVLRAAKGAHFHLPYQTKRAQEIIEMDLSLFVADTKGSLLSETHFSGKRGLILSNEAKGISSHFSSVPKVTIPMTSFVESLNVASSGAILLYAMRPNP